MVWKSYPDASRHSSMPFLDILRINTAGSRDLSDQTLLG
jgi:hypothetical protein